MEDVKTEAWMSLTIHPSSWSHHDTAHGTSSRTYTDIYNEEKTYAKSLVGKMRNGSLRDDHLIRFARYAARRLRQERDAGAGGSSSAYMVANEESTEDPRILAILDTGCNNTCHGDRWMQCFAEAHGHLPEIEEAMGKFRGVSRKVMVAGKRTIPLKMRTLDDEMSAGTIASIELQDSNAPLLLSAGAQQALGLVLDMGNNTIYSRKLMQDISHGGVCRGSYVERIGGWHGIEHFSSH